MYICFFKVTYANYSTLKSIKDIFKKKINGKTHKTNKSFAKVKLTEKDESEVLRESFDEL